MEKNSDNFKINEIIKKIRLLEDELLEELKEKEKKFFYKIEDGKAQFRHDFIEEGKLKIKSSIKYLSSFSVLAILTIPFIWLMILPILIIDILVSIYQAICFPIYKIPKVKRKDYIIMDRYNLFYLDRVEKINCWYCEYFNGVIVYVREIAARTEQFWCPIRHSTTPKDKHSRYDKFFDYGDYSTYLKELKKRREDFTDIDN